MLRRLQRDRSTVFRPLGYRDRGPRLITSSLSERLQLPPGGPPSAVWVRGVKHDASEYVVMVQGDDGQPLLVGCALFEGVLLPACIDLQRVTSYAAWRGSVLQTTCLGNLWPRMCGNAPIVYASNNNVEMLIVRRGSAEWVEASDGDVPAHAFPVCPMPSGETACAARVRRGTGFLLGRVQPSDGACTVTHDGKVMAFKNYEVLVVM